MIQIRGKTILSMEFNPIIKAHDSNSWQYYFINEIQPHDQTPRFKPMANYLLEAQFLLATSKTQFPLATSKSLVLIGNIKKPNSHWQYQKPNLRWHYFINSPRLLTLGKKYYVIIISFKRWIMSLKHYCGKNHGNHFIKYCGKL